MWRITFIFSEFVLKIGLVECWSNGEVGPIPDEPNDASFSSLLARIIRGVTAIEMQPFRSEGNAAVL